MSKLRDVRLAVKALVAGVLPYAKIHGFDQTGKKPDRADAGGDVFGRAALADDNGTDLSPLTYHYIVTIPVDLAPPAGVADADAWLDSALGAIGAAVKAEATGARLGGLADWLETRPADIDDADLSGAATLRWAGTDILVHCCTTDPLN